MIREVDGNAIITKEVSVGKIYPRYTDDENGKGITITFNVKTIKEVNIDTLYSRMHVQFNKQISRKEFDSLVKGIIDCAILEAFGVARYPIIKEDDGTLTGYEEKEENKNA